MRPSDPHQQRAARPSLFAKARRMPADGILARLDRGAAAPAASDKGWMFAGGATVLLLIGVLAWVVHLNTLKPKLLPPEPVAHAPAPPAPVLHPARSQPAVIVEQRQARVAIAPSPKVRDIPPASQHFAARPAEHAPRVKKTAPPSHAEAPEAGIDTDVAILSVIVAHRAAIAAAPKTSAKPADSN
ncbi:MAG: hypothetical protein V4463_12825 [Pseudomonadota bacterium]